MWELRKEVLGWVMDGATMGIELSKKRQEQILKELKQALKKKRGLPFKKFEKLTIIFEYFTVFTLKIIHVTKHFPNFIIWDS